MEIVTKARLTQKTKDELQKVLSEHGHTETMLILNAVDAYIKSPLTTIIALNQIKLNGYIGK